MSTYYKHIRIYIVLGSLSLLISSKQYLCHFKNLDLPFCDECKTYVFSTYVFYIFSKSKKYNSGGLLQTLGI